MYIYCGLYSPWLIFLCILIQRGLSLIKKNVFWIKVLDQTAEPDFERLVDFVIRTYHYDFLLCMFAKQVYCSPQSLQVFILKVLFFKKFVFTFIY